MEERDSRWDAYRAAIVRVRLPGGLVEVAPSVAPHGSMAFPFPPDAVVHIVTAHDSAVVGAPDGAAANESRNAALLTDLEALGVEWHPAVGADPEWTHREASFAVVGLTLEQALELGRRYEQDAIFEWAAEWWRLVDCRTGAAHSSRWVASVVDVGGSA